MSALEYNVNHSEPIQGDQELKPVKPWDRSQEEWNLKFNELTKYRSKQEKPPGKKIKHGFIPDSPEANHNLKYAHFRKKYDTFDNGNIWCEKGFKQNGYKEECIENDLDLGGKMKKSRKSRRLRNNKKRRTIRKSLRRAKR